MLRVFELRDVDWARLVMSVFMICTSCLTLTEIFPSLYSQFEILASKEWQIFFSSLKYRNSFTGAPLLAIFSAGIFHLKFQILHREFLGSLSAILAFACPLAYLVKLLNVSTLLKCVFKSLLVLYYYYRPEFRNESYLVSPSTTQYSKLQSKNQKETNLKNKISGIINGWKKNVDPNRNRTPSLYFKSENQKLIKK